jgi:hypothetical protein
MARPFTSAVNYSTACPRAVHRQGGGLLDPLSGSLIGKYIEIGGRHATRGGDCSGDGAGERSGPQIDSNERNPLIRLKRIYNF